MYTVHLSNDKNTPNLVISPIVNSQRSFLGFRSDHREKGQIYPCIALLLA